jgi:DNA-binding response OmpR family regulator
MIEARAVHDKDAGTLTGRKVLIVEDEQDIAELLALHLRDVCGQVEIAVDGHEAMRLGFSREWDLIILDLCLPGPGGLDICRSLRRNERYVPILMLTSKSSELDRVLGLEIGADDYVTKLFSVSELMARVRAIFRRVEALRERPPDEAGTLRAGGLSVDAASRSVTVEGRSVDLTAREFDLLQHFVSYPGRVFRRAQLLDSVWGYGHDGYEHTVNSHINRLRAKIEPDPAHPSYIVTVWGVGYKLEAGGAPSQV